MHSHTDLAGNYLELAFRKRWFPQDYVAEMEEELWAAHPRDAVAKIGDKTEHRKQCSKSPDITSGN